MAARSASSLFTSEGCAFMKNVYFVQAVASCDNFTAYLPYASSCLIAYALRDSDIAAGYRFNDIIYARKMTTSSKPCASRLWPPFLQPVELRVFEATRQNQESHPPASSFSAAIIFHGGGFLTKTRSLIFNLRRGRAAIAALLKTLLNGGGFGGIDNNLPRRKRRCCNPRSTTTTSRTILRLTSAAFLTAYSNGTPA